MKTMQIDAYLKKLEQFPSDLNTNNGRTKIWLDFKTVKVLKYNAQEMKDELWGYMQLPILINKPKGAMWVLYRLFSWIGVLSSPIKLAEKYFIQSVDLKNEAQNMRKINQSVHTAMRRVLGSGDQPTGFLKKYECPNFDNDNYSDSHWRQAGLDDELILRARAHETGVFKGAFLEGNY